MEVQIFFVVRCISRFDCFNHCGTKSGVVTTWFDCQKVVPLLSTSLGGVWKFLPAQPLHIPETLNHNVPLSSMQVMVNGKMMLRQMWQLEGLWMRDFQSEEMRLQNGNVDV